MKKNIKYLLIGLLVISAFTSCDNDATNGILSNIVNSELQEEYEIKAVATKDNALFYSVEADGIYLTKRIDNERTLILDTSDYLNISSIYIGDTNIYFKSSNKDDVRESALYCFTKSQTKITSGVTEIKVDGSFKELTTNGYVVAKADDDSFYYKKITALSDTTFATATDSLSTTVVVGDEIILQTINTAGKFDYYSTDGSIEINNIKNQDFKIVAAVLDGTGYYCVLSNASLIKIEANTNTKLYENTNTNYTFKNKAQSLFVTTPNLLIVFDSTNNVLLYDIDNIAADDGFQSLTEGFANILRNTSDIVGAFRDTDNKYYIATNTNGYYTVNFTDIAEIINDDSENSTCVSSLVL